jgi:hypothetical protein
LGGVREGPRLPAALPSWQCCGLSLHPPPGSAVEFALRSIHSTPPSTRPASSVGEGPMARRNRADQPQSFGAPVHTVTDGPAQRVSFGEPATAQSCSARRRARCAPSGTRGTAAASPEAVAPAVDSPSALRRYCFPLIRLRLGLRLRERLQASTCAGDSKPLDGINRAPVRHQSCASSTKSREADDNRHSGPADCRFATSAPIDVSSRSDTHCRMRFQ